MTAGLAAARLAGKPGPVRAGAPGKRSRLGVQNAAADARKIAPFQGGGREERLDGRRADFEKPPKRRSRLGFSRGNAARGSVLAAETLLAARF